MESLPRAKGPLESAESGKRNTKLLSRYGACAYGTDKANARIHLLTDQPHQSCNNDVLISIWISRMVFIENLRIA